MNQIAFKLGTTFAASVAYTPTPGGPADLSTLAIKSQVRKGTTLVAELTVIKAADNLSFALSAPAGTALWPVGTLACDIRFELEDVVFYSDSFDIVTSKPVTLPG